MHFKSFLEADYPNKKIVYSDTVNFNLTRHLDYDLHLVTHDGPRSTHFVLTQYLKENEQISVCDLLQTFSKMPIDNDQVLDLKIVGDRYFMSGGKVKGGNAQLQIERNAEQAYEIYEDGRLIRPFHVLDNSVCIHLLEEYNFVSMALIYRKGAND